MSLHVLSVLLELAVEDQGLEVVAWCSCFHDGNSFEAIRCKFLFFNHCIHTIFCEKIVIFAPLFGQNKK